MLVIHIETTVEPPLTTTSKEQPHAIKRQVRIETTMTSISGTATSLLCTTSSFLVPNQL